MARYEFAIGTTVGNMQYLFELGVPAPRCEFKPYSKAVVTGSLRVLGQGFSMTVWDWNMIREPARNVMKGYCAGLSSTVYIRTYNDSLASPAWEVYHAIMLWTPEAEDRQNAARLKLVIPFKLLSLVEE